MTPEELIARLDGQVPIVLLPIRLETRFSPDRQHLRIRIYPDSFHKDDHEPEVTDAELAAGQRYWRARWTAGTDAAQANAAWQVIAATSRPPRARWIIDATTPSNLSALGQGEPQFPDVARKDAVWTRAARAALLPKRWVALGYREDREVARVWSASVSETVAMGPAPETPNAPPPADGELPIDEGMRWLVDYQRAVDAGMAITIADADVADGLAEGLDTLIVTGVDWSLDPDAGAGALTGRLTGAAASDGFSFLPVGTPTNNTTADSTRALADSAAFDPLNTPASLPADSAGALAARAFDLDQGLVAVGPGADRRDDVAARHMATALWPTTWGYFLDQMMRPLVGDDTVAAVRDHFRDWVRGRGPLPTLRVANQPYGVLPVVAPGAWSGDDAVEGQIGALAGKIRSVWARAGATMRGLGSSAAPDRDLLTLLRMTPRSASFRSRRVAGAVLLASTQGFDALAPFQERGATTLLSLAGITGRPRLVDATLDAAHRLLPVPLVARGDLSEAAPLNPNYVADIASGLARRGGFAGIVTKPAPPQSILEALLQQSAQIAVTDASTRLVADFEVAQGTLQAMPAQVALRERELHGIDPVDTAPVTAGTRPSLLNSVTGALEVADLTVLQISGTDKLADHLATQSIGELVNATATRELGELRESLEFLAGLPAAELGRLAAETLDCCSHRLDAWLTSLATRRLSELREAVSGSYIGAFGWLEDIRPRADTASFGYVHAPSVGHAASAAILRSGHLAHRAEDSGAFAVDLSSHRVQGALELLDGMRQGQPIGALLGYRLERALRDRRVELAGYVLALRQAAPLATATDGFGDNKPLEAIAARDVVDGLALLDLWRGKANTFFTRPGLPVASPDRDDIDAELVALDDCLDAVTDLLLAETVHQMVVGNDERAGAALDALDRQTVLPDVGVAKTPRSGVSTSHRLLLALRDDAAPTGWPTDPRSAAEPRLNAWAAKILGDPTTMRFQGIVRDETGAELARVAATHAELGLSPMATLLAASGVGGADQPTELDARVAMALAAKVNVTDAAALEVSADMPGSAPAGSIGLGELLALARELLDVAASGRPANAAELVMDRDLRDPAPVDPGYDTAELKARADSAVSALEAALDGLPAPGAIGSTQSRADALMACVDAGVVGAIPSSADGDALATQVERVRVAGTEALAAVRAADSAFGRAEASSTAQVEHDLRRLQAVFGQAFPAAARFTVANADALRASLNDADALLHADPLAPATWLYQHAMVRPGAARLATVLSAAEALGREVGADQLQVAQLPHVEGDRWIALDGDRSAGSLGLVVHSPDGWQPDEPAAMWVLDAWQDVVPAATETTGVSFHFDAPGARAPQAILIAVPPNRAATAWSLETLLASVREALDLTRMRSVSIDDLEAAPRFLPAIYLAFNLEAKTPSVDLNKIIDAAVTFDNIAFGAGGPT